MLPQKLLVTLTLALNVAAAPQGGLLGALLGSGGTASPSGTPNIGSGNGNGNGDNNGNGNSVGSGNTVNVGNNDTFGLINKCGQTPNQSGLINIAKRALEHLGLRSPDPFPTYGKRQDSSTPTQDGLINVGPLLC